MKKILSLLISFSFLFFFCGCGDTTPLKEKLIVEGIAIDSTEKEFLVTLQVYSPSGDGSGKGEDQLFSAKGKTVYEALQRVDENTGKISYYADTKVIVFSYQSLQKGLWNNLEFFIRSSEMGTNVCLAVTMDKAADLFQIEKEGANMPARVLSNALHYGKTDARPFSGELMTVSASLLTENSDVAIPILTTEEKDKKKYPVQNGILCFQKETPKVSMTEKHKWAYNWLHEYYDDRALVVTFQDTDYALQIRDVQRQIKPQPKNGHPAFSLELHLECDIMETNTAHGITLSQMSDFKEAVEQVVENITREAVDTVFTGQQCDVFDFGRALKKYQPEYFKALADWRSEIPLCTFNYAAHVTIARVGQGNIG